MYELIQLSCTEMIELARESSIDVEQRESGALRLELIGTKTDLTISIDWVNEQLDKFSIDRVSEQLDKLHKPLMQYVLAGRENTPFKFNGYREQKIVDSPIEDWRCLVTNNHELLKKICLAALKSGWCTADDFYFFPVDGHYMGYISHHDVMEIDLRTEKTL